jgi:Big-like domain-containing protein
VLLAGLWGAACANPGDPPGGPPDTAPPAILAIRPDSGTIAPDLKGDAVIQFDEVIEEMAGGPGGRSGGGAAGLSGIERQVVLSPVAGPVKVTWHRTAIHIRPKEGWQRARVYRLELLPGIVDLRRNVLPTGRTILFSTGPALPSARLEGSAVLWVEQRTLPLALIQAVREPDTVAYLTVADSSGKFRLDGIPAGRYTVYAVHDQNGNRQRERREAYDSVAVTVDSAAQAVLWAFVHDTAGPGLRSAEPADSLHTRLTFAQPLDPNAPIQSSRVQVLALPDSSPVPVEAVLSVAQYDSTKRTTDTTAARDSAAAGGPPPAAQRAPAVGRPPATAVQQDTSALRRLLRTRPVPSDKIVVRVGRPFAQGQKYLIRVLGAANLNGARADAQAVLTVPAAPPPTAARDTTRQPRDTTP